MKSKVILFTLLTFCFLALSSCGPDNVDYANKVVGSYNFKITPNINLTFDGNVLPAISSEEIETTGTITKDDEEGNVTIRINAVNGYINGIEMKAVCSGLGMNIEDSSYDGVLYSDEYGGIECDFNLKNPTTTISNAKIFNWSTTVTGQCDVNYIGLDMKCDVNGTIDFYATPITTSK